MPELIVKVIGDTSALDKAFRRSSRQTKSFGNDLERAGRGAAAASLSFHGLGRSVAFASGAFLGGAGLVSVLKSSVSAASNLAEQTSKSNVVFAQSAGVVEEWAKTTVDSMGLAEDQALETASSFGALLRPIGLTGAAAAAQSQKLTQLGADLASFYNTSVQDALDAIRSGLVGEVEPLRRYGVLLSETRVQSEAFAETGKKTAASLTPQEKVLARLALVYKDTSQAQGDFARTSDGLANQQRILAANVRKLETELGSTLIPVVTDVVSGLNDWLSNTENQERAQLDFKKAVDLVVGSAKTAVGVFNDVSDALGGVTKAVELLLAATLVKKITGFSGALAGGAGASSVAGSAEAAAVKVGLLRGALLGLSEIALPVIVLDVAIRLSDSKTGKKLGLDYSAVDLVKDIHKNFGDIVSGMPAIGPIVNALTTTKPSQVWAAFFNALTNLTKVDNVASKLSAVEAGVTRIAEATALPSKVKVKVKGGAAPTAAQKRAIALAQTSGTGTAAEVAAVRDQLAADNRAIDFARGRIAAGRGNLRAFADQLIRLEGERRGLLDRLGAISDANATAAKASRAKVKAARAKTKAAHLAFIADLQGQLGDFSDLGVKGGPLTIQAINRSIAKDQARLRQVAQFKALGLTGTGDALAPTRRALLAELGKTQKGLAGTILDTDANRNLIGRIRKVLSREFGALTRETKLKVKELLDALQGGDKKIDPTSFRHISGAKFRDIAGLNLSGLAARRFDTAFAQVGAGGTLPSRRSAAFSGAGTVTINGGLHVHGVQNVAELENEITKRARSRPQVRRGAR